MTVKKINFPVASSDGVHTLAGVVYLPDGEAKGFFHIVHGMTEHIARYDTFMTALAHEGYICFGYDNLGHGYTARDDSELGYIAKKKGDELLAKDVAVFRKAVVAEYDEGKNLPYYLMGHSMGSFIVRMAAEKYTTPDKLIIMGTGGANPAASAGLAVISIVKLFYGDKHISPLVDKLAFGSYNKRFGGASADDASPWLTNDRSVREKYYADKFCSFKFTVSAMGDLIRVMKNSNRAAWYKNLCKNIPVLLVSGEEDPVGNYGKGVREVCQKLTSQGVGAKCILYKGARHEILNDFTYDELKSDILAFIAE